MRSVRLLVSLSAWMLVSVAQAAATPGGVVYIKDGQVWLAKLDGSKKVQLSDGDAWWNAVGQSSTGGIVATKKEPGKIFQLTQFRVWNPDGTVKDDGPASPGTNFSGSLAMPLGLELTAGNRGIIYGYSHGVWNYGTIPATYSLAQGFALLPTDTRTSPTSTFTATDIRWPSLVAGRLIGTPDNVGVKVEDAGGNNTSNFSVWPGLVFNGVPDAKVNAIQASDDGKLLTAQIDIDSSLTPELDQARVQVVKTAGLLGAYVDDCVLPATGKAQSADITADGSLVAWADEQGLKVAPPPNLRSGGPSDCDMTAAPTLIDAGAKYPAFGPVDVDAIYAARNPAAPGGPTTTPTAPGGGPATTTTTTTPPLPPAKPVVPGLTLRTATAGGTIQVVASRAGKVTVTVTVAAKSVGRKGRPVVIASGSVKAKKQGAVKIKLKPTKAGKALRKKLKGIKVTVVVRAGGKVTTKTVTLG